jgi:hypothetical protein
MNLVTNPHRRRTGAIAQAVHCFQRESAVCGRFTEVDPQALACMLLQFPRTHGLARFGPAQMNQVFSYRLGTEIMVKADHAMDFGPGQAHGSGNCCNRIARNMAQLVLDFMKDRQQGADFAALAFYRGFDYLLNGNGS